MLLSDPEMESSILISSDEGTTYQKYRLTFYIQSLLFHPKQEDWVLAYSLDQKVNKHCVYKLSFWGKRLFAQPRFGEVLVTFHYSNHVGLVFGDELHFVTLN